MSSDSSEEESERIKEAIDENFLTKDLYRCDTSKKKIKSSPVPVNSCRSQNQKLMLNNPLTIKVSPEFQKHVSKHLSNLLDEVIDDTKLVVKSRKVENGFLNSGVKLLSSSKSYLNISKNFENTLKQKKFAKKTLSNCDYEKRAKEVAVSGEWVLSQEDTKYWAPNMKGEIEIVKIDNFPSKVSNKRKKKQKL